jgi:hypothetical protein
MKRPDGTRVKEGLTPVMQALPHIMPKRYDAMNWANDYLDEDIIKKYIREKRREGHLVTHMSLLIAAYYKAALEHMVIADTLREGVYRMLDAKKRMGHEDLDDAKKVWAFEVEMDMDKRECVQRKLDMYKA